MKRKAFSLIELMVTVVVIAVLAGILSGVLSNVREGAQAARCISNLRMIGAAAQQYFADREGAFFPTKYWDIYPSWGTAGKQGMRDYLGVESRLANVTGVPEFYRDTIVTCPSAQAQFPQIEAPLHRTYAFNYYLNQLDPSSTYNSRPLDQRPQLPGGYHKVGNVPNPAAMWMFTEGVPEVEEGYYGTSIASNASAARMSFPHKDRQHFVFLDGHVETLLRDEFIARGESDDFFGKNTGG